MILSTQQQSSYSSEDEYLNPLRHNFLPANQIITKKYEPDVSPTFKFLAIKERQKVEKHWEKRKENNAANKTIFKFDFQERDSLGYYYADRIKHSLLYLKFDNRGHFRCPENRNKYLAGFFVPLDTLLKPEVKNHKNLYKALNQSDKLPLFDYQENIQDSFKQNCYSSQNQTKFSSNYESSNLFMAMKTGELQYDLILQNDINSKGTTQWFNFAVQVSQVSTYKFNIVNLTKSHSLFQSGMKIPYFSYQNNLILNTPWSRGCSNILYCKNQINRQGRISQNYYYTLHFEYENVHKNDTVIFSYCFPYVSLDMERSFNKITQKKLSMSLKVEKIKVSETLSGQPLFVYHLYPKRSITSLNNLHNRSHLSLLEKKLHKNGENQAQSIVFMARQHPGESQSSFILEGIIQFLLENNQYDNNKKNFHYYIFPIVNVDGVYYGNYRTNLSGNDLNRIWKQPRKDFHSQVYYIKKYLLNVNRIAQIKLIIDLHGHSSAMNSFFYGNPSKKQGGFQNDNPKLFPYYCSKQIKQISFSQSTFKISQDKKNSARVVLNQMFPKASVYTLQNSFFGYKKGKKVVEYTIDRYKKLGRKLMTSYIQFVKITQRAPLIKQKWQKEIQFLLLNAKKSAKRQNPSDSDSEASHELIQFESQYEKIDKQIQLQNKLKQNEDNLSAKRNLFGDKGCNFKSRLYERKRSKYNSGIYTDQKRTGWGVNTIYIQDNLNSSTQYNYPAHQQQGFLSIVRIQTKKSLGQKKTDNQNSKSLCVKTIIIDQKQEQQKQNMISETPIEQLKTLPVSPQPKTLFSRKQYFIRPQIKQQIPSQKRQIKFFNEKQFLLKRRRSINKSAEQVFTNERERYIKTFQQQRLNDNINSLKSSGGLYMMQREEKQNRGFYNC